MYHVPAIRPTRSGENALCAHLMWLSSQKSLHQCHEALANMPTKNRVQEAAACGRKQVVSRCQRPFFHIQTQKHEDSLMSRSVPQEQHNVTQCSACDCATCCTNTTPFTNHPDRTKLVNDHPPQQKLCVVVSEARACMGHLQRNGGGASEMGLHAAAGTDGRQQHAQWQQLLHRILQQHSATLDCEACAVQ